MCASLPNKLALFDFDGTLVDFDTVNPFIRFVLKTHPELDVDPDLTLPHKQYRLKLLKGLTEFELSQLAEQYYEKEIKPNLIPQTTNELKRLCDKGYKICVVSGSYDVYLQYFCNEYRIDSLVCTTILYRDGICQGAFDGLDCLGSNKLVLLRDVYGVDSFLEIQSVAYSDSSSDLPLFHACRESFAVVPECCKTPVWIEDSQIGLIKYQLKWTKRARRKLGYWARRLSGVSN